MMHILIAYKGEQPSSKKNPNHPGMVWCFVCKQGLGLSFQESLVAKAGGYKIGNDISYQLKSFKKKMKQNPNYNQKRMNGCG